MHTEKGPRKYLKKKETLKWSQKGDEFMFLFLPSFHPSDRKILEGQKHDACSEI